MSTKEGRNIVWDLKNAGWVYCGGDKDEADRHTWLHYKRKLGIDEDYNLKKRKKCPCGKPIIHNCYIYNVNDKGHYIFRVVGQSCVHKFYNNEYLEARKNNRKLCPICNKIHSNSKRTNLCQECCLLSCKNCGKKKGDKKYKYCYRCFIQIRIS